jgi:hypothetical protein
VKIPKGTRRGPQGLKRNPRKTGREKTILFNGKPKNGRKTTRNAAWATREMYEKIATDLKEKDKDEGNPLPSPTLAMPLCVSQKRQESCKVILQRDT